MKTDAKQFEDVPEEGQLGSEQPDGMSKTPPASSQQVFQQEDSVRALLVLAHRQIISLLLVLALL